MVDKISIQAPRVSLPELRKGVFQTFSKDQCYFIQVIHNHQFPTNHISNYCQQVKTCRWKMKSKTTTEMVQQQIEFGKIWISNILTTLNLQGHADIYGVMFQILFEYSESEFMCKLQLFLRISLGSSIGTRYLKIKK